MEAYYFNFTVKVILIFRAELKYNTFSNNTF